MNNCMGPPRQPAINRTTYQDESRSMSRSERRSPKGRLILAQAELADARAEIKRLKDELEYARGES